MRIISPSVYLYCLIAVVFWVGRAAAAMSPLAAVDPPAAENL
jgi:hypothetical protein